MSNGKHSSVVRGGGHAYEGNEESPPRGGQGDDTLP